MFLLSGRNSAVDVPDLQHVFKKISRKIWDALIFWRLPSIVDGCSAWRLRNPQNKLHRAFKGPGHGALTEVLADELKSFPKVLQKMRGCERWAYLVSCPRWPEMARDFRRVEFVCEIQEDVFFDVIQQSSMTGDRNETKINKVHLRSGWFFLEILVVLSSDSSFGPEQQETWRGVSRGDRKNVPKIWVNLIMTSLRTPLVRDG